MIAVNNEALSVLSRLKAGNERYVASLQTDKRSTLSPILTHHHKPCAVILGCSDARVPVELVFDQGLGDLFVIRVAGNVVAPSQIGSVEFAVEKFATKLVVVLGHSYCGAVTACVEALVSDNQYSPNLQSIVDRIRPSVLNLHEIASARHDKIDTKHFLDQAIRANVSFSVSQLKHGSQFLENMVNVGELVIIGAEYDLDTGKVAFFD